MKSTSSVLTQSTFIMVFSFKLDPSSLPKLSSKGDNYTQWKSTWMITFKHAELWNIISGKNPRPSADGDAQDAWEKKDNDAMVMLLSSVHQDHTTSVATCETSQKAWKYLSERFDRDTSGAAIHLFRSLANLRYKDGENLRTHVDDFHQLWTRMGNRCRASNQTVAKAMRPIFESDEVKGSFFLTTLPDTMDNIIDNLSTREILTFNAIEPKMLDIAENHSLNTEIDSAAYYTTTRKPAKVIVDKGKSKGSTGTQSTQQINNENECNWCRKHNFQFAGHIWTNCQRLKDHKKGKQGKDGPGGSASKKQKGKIGKANVVELDSDSDDVSTSVTAFCAHEVATINPNGKRLRQLDGSSTHKPAVTIPNPPTATGHFVSYDEFHAAMGHNHLQPTAPNRLYKDGHLAPTKPDDFHCPTCQLSKSTRTKPTAIESRSTNPLELIHSDLSGKFSHKSLKGSRYFILFIDDCTRFVWVRFVARKSEVPKTVKDFVRYLRTQHPSTEIKRFSVTKRFRSDNGGEYINQDIAQLFREEGIDHEVSPPFSHESNGLAERYMRTIVTNTRAMIQDDAILFLWPEAIHTSVFLRNICPHSALPNQITPFEAMHETKPSIGYLHPFGQTVYVHIPKEARKPDSKLLHRAEEGLFVGYGKSSKIRRVYIPARNAIFESRDVKFKPFELSQPPAIEIDIVDSVPLPRQTPPQLPVEQPTETFGMNPPTQSKLERSTRTPAPPQFTTSYEDIPGGFSSEPESPTAGGESRTPSFLSSPRTTRSGRTIRPPAKVREHGRVAYDGDDPIHAYAFATQTDDIPITYKEARNSPHWLQWKDAMINELKSHETNGTWTVVPYTHVQNIVGTRWVYALKHHADGSIARHKARLVAQGFSQIQGIDFDETYAPVVRYDSLRLLLRIASLKGYVVHQMDFDAASQLIWIKSALEELGFHPRCEIATDNQAAIHLATDHRINARSKHIAIHYHFTRERIQTGDFTILHVPSADNLADICTKSLPLPLFRNLKHRILN